MNEAFYALEEEKQRAVFNAAMEVFSRWEYKRASTDLIAARRESPRDCCSIISTTSAPFILRPLPTPSGW